MASGCYRQRLVRGQVTAVFIVLLWIPSYSGQQMDCGPRGEAVEGGVHTLTCRGLQAGHTVQWIKTHEPTVRLTVANCTAVNVCATDFPGRYQVSRASDATSTLKIRDVTRDVIYVSGNWTCAAGSTTSSCEVAVIYPPDHEGCTVRFDESSGQVVGQCFIHKVFPSPACSWSEQRQGDQWVQIPGNQTTLEETQYVDSSNSQIYFRSTCHLHRPLPATEGRYTYKVLVNPGYVQPQINFSSTNLIRAPTSPQVAISCPVDYVSDASAASCTCVTSDLGSPTGTLAWLDPDGRHVISSSTKTLTLTFVHVTSPNNGRRYHCEVEHHTGSLRVSYTPNIAVPPNTPNISGMPANALSPAQTLTLTCRAAGGRPGVTRVVFRCLEQADQPDIQEGGVVVSRLTLTLSLANDGMNCTCYADNGYLTSKTVNVLLKLSGSSTKDSGEVSTTIYITIGVVVAAAAVLFVLVTVVCQVWKCYEKRKDGNQTTESTDARFRRLHSEEHSNSGQNESPPRAVSPFTSTQDSNTPQNSNFNTTNETGFSYSTSSKSMGKSSKTATNQKREKNPSRLKKEKECGKAAVDSQQKNLGKRRRDPTVANVQGHEQSQDGQQSSWTESGDEKRQQCPSHNVPTSEHGGHLSPNEENRLNSIKECYPSKLHFHQKEHAERSGPKEAWSCSPVKNTTQTSPGAFGEGDTPRRTSARSRQYETDRKSGLHNSTSSTAIVPMRKKSTQRRQSKKTLEAIRNPHEHADFGCSEEEETEDSASPHLEENESEQSSSPNDLDKQYSKRQSMHTGRADKNSDDIDRSNQREDAGKKSAHRPMVYPRGLPNSNQAGLHQVHITGAAEREGKEDMLQSVESQKRNHRKPSQPACRNDEVNLERAVSCPSLVGSGELIRTAESGNVKQVPNRPLPPRPQTSYSSSSKGHSRVSGDSSTMDSARAQRPTATYYSYGDVMSGRPRNATARAGQPKPRLRSKSVDYTKSCKTSQYVSSSVDV